MTDATAPGLASPRRGATLAAILLTVPVTLALAAVPAIPRCLALTAWAGVAALVIDRLPAGHPHGRFGLANAVTLGRAAGTALLAALATVPQAIGDGWAIAAAVTGLLVLDAIDGRAARRQGLASAFGARFDMEVDAALILTLAALAAGLGKAGPWVLAIGLMRYGFVLAGLADPALRRPLPPSRRRDAVCALQVAALGAILAPPVMPPLSGAIAAVALAALAASFAADVAWLRRPR